MQVTRNFLDCKVLSNGEWADASFIISDIKAIKQDTNEDRSIIYCCSERFIADVPVKKLRKALGNANGEANL